MIKSNQNKRKVGILTFVRSNNYGTLLQAYALSKLLQNALGNNFIVEIVNIRVHSSGASLTERLLQKRALKEFWFVLKSKWNHIKMQNYLRRELPVSPERTGMDYEECIQFLRDQNYDVLVSGSDEIWTNKPGVPIPNVFFIPREIEAVKISMAPSANRGDYELLNEKQKELITQSLDDYSYLSVRDGNTKLFIKNFTDRPIHILSDPTLAYDFTNVVFHNKKINEAKRQNKKLILLMLKNHTIAKEIISEYGEECMIVSVFSLYNNTVRLLPTPLEFTVLFKQFDLTITDFFHGTAFAIKNNVPFISIDNENIYKKYESKIAYMLKSLSLSNHYLQIWDNCKSEYNNLLDKIQEMIGKSFDYSHCIAQVKSEYDKALTEIVNIIRER